MPGRYYAKHTLNHTIDNQDKIKQLNNAFKSMTVNYANEYLRTTTDSIDQKIVYLRNLQTNNYRHGRKYKYDCNLSEYEIKQLIKNVGDEELFTAYAGLSISQDNDRNNTILAIIVLAIIVLCILFSTIH